jgi:hypothetical protein
MSRGARLLRIALRAAAAALLLFAALLAWVLYPPPTRNITFPDGKRFAFTIVDDTDQATLERNEPVYDLLSRYGLRTTKTVWVLEPTEVTHTTNLGDSLSDPAYRQFIIGLQGRGFEIGLHGVRGGSSPRQDIIEGLDEFKAALGHDPSIHVNHSENRDNLYWGSDRWSFAPYRWAYGLIENVDFSGEDPASAHFWGDIAKKRIRYVNQFTFSDINLLNVTQTFPYRLADKPYVNAWFPTSDGDNLDRFEELLSTRNLDRLEREGGVCLVYAHLGAGSFNDGDAVDPRFEARIKDLASRNGWFVPASEILDYLRQQPGWNEEPGLREKIRLETLFLWTVITR